MSAIFNTLLTSVVTLFLECIALLPEIKYYYLLLTIVDNLHVETQTTFFSEAVHKNLKINP